jgi:glycosyltransferase involved in cell wall biosynthesis
VHISIIIPAFNVAPFLSDALRSVLSQTYADWSCVIVDDGSTDDPGAIVARFPDNRISFIRQKNAGVSAARNTGIDAYRGQARLSTVRANVSWPGLAKPGHDTTRKARAASVKFASMGGNPLPLVMPGLDPGTPTTAGIRGDHRVKPGDDVREVCRLGQSNSSLDPYPDAYGAKPGDDRATPTLIADAFLFLDGDDWLAPNALALLVRALEDSPRAVAACGRYARVARNGVARLSPLSPEGNLLERLLIRNLFANGGHLLIRREAIEAAGEFRRDLSYGEDWEYWTRLALLGEFVSVRSPSPILFVRERTGSAYLSRATDPEAHRPAIDAIHRNPAFAERLGKTRMACLQTRAEAETAWTVGRELIRHGHPRIGRRWLVGSISNAPSIKRLAMIALSLFSLGPFRPYSTAD